MIRYEILYVDPLCFPLTLPWHAASHFNVCSSGLWVLPRTPRTHWEGMAGQPCLGPAGNWGSGRWLQIWGRMGIALLRVLREGVLARVWSLRGCRLTVRVLLICIHPSGGDWLNDPWENVQDHVLGSFWGLSWEYGCQTKMWGETQSLGKTTFCYLKLLKRNITSCSLCFAEVLKINKCLLNSEGRKMSTCFSLLHLVGWVFFPCNCLHHILLACPARILFT